MCGKQLAPASTFPTDQYKKLLDQSTAVLDREPDCFQENRKEVAELRVYKQMMGSYRPFRAVIDGLNIAYVDNSCNINNVRAHIHMYVYYVCVCVCVHNMCIIYYVHACVCVCVCVFHHLNAVTTCTHTCTDMSIIDLFAFVHALYIDKTKL